ncbi:DUF2637 domain-containing protein [Nocardioides sp. DS6]|uniref:DUF2637 domain-containing protein n=1 Tax=Nocardioides eburneus TaxID=3231482 RepID=A0ABV3SYL1_9ACTN
MSWFERVAFAVTCLCLTAVTCATFVLAFDAIRAEAIATHVVFPGAAWRVPIAIDGGELAAAASPFIRIQRGDRPRAAELILAIGLMAPSAITNDAHAGSEWLAKLLARLPPFVQVLSLEILLSALHERQHRNVKAPAPATNPTPTQPDRRAEAMSATTVSTSKPEPRPAVPTGTLHAAS